MKKRIIALLLAAICVIAIAACKGNETGKTEGGDSSLPAEVAAIKTAGKLKVGVKSDVPGFGLLDTATGKYEGMEIEIAKLFAKEIFGDDSKVEFIAVTAATRGPLLDSGDIDMVIATFTIKEDRRLSWNFSTTYYTDAVGLLVKSNAGYNSLADLAGKTIGVATSATSQKAVQDAADEKGMSVNFSEFATYPEIKAALDSGRVDAFSVDKSILRGYLDASTVLLDDAFSPQEYGVATKLTKLELTKWVDDLIVKWLNDGTIAKLCKDYNI